MILNGTPVSKNEADLYAQWEILDWRVLGYRSFYSFSANHLVYDDKYPNKIIRTLNVDYLTRRMAPYTYQVLKNDCINLPPKTYESKYYYLTENQSEFYDYIAQKMLLELDELKPHTIYKLFSALQDVISGLYVTEDEKTKRIKTSPFFNKIEENPRIQKLMDIISCIDDKVIIYCKYTHEILSIVELLNKTYGAGSAVPFYGGITHKKRAENKQRFENSTKFFVANKQCAGFGLNLQFCNYIIFYSNDWDYGTRTQAEDRVHRNGQKNNVCIIDIIAEHTLDERIKRCLFRKECLVDEFRDEIRRIKDAKVIDAWIHGRGE